MLSEAKHLCDELMRASSPEMLRFAQNDIFDITSFIIKVHQRASIKLLLLLIMHHQQRQFRCSEDAFGDAAHAHAL